MRSLAPVDRATLVYLLIATIALVAHWPVRAPAAALLPVAHAALAAVVLLAPAARRGGPVGRFLGDLYPLILVSFLYTEIGLMNTSAGRSHDLLIQAVEGLCFGAQPSREWIRAWPWPWLSTLLHAGYLSYYAIVAVPPLALWLTRKRAAAERVVLLATTTFYICYVVFLLFPVAGPRYTFPPAANAATAIPLARATQRFLNAGAAWGTAFPSSHVAVALVTSIRSAWSSRLLGAVFVPLAILLTLGTVYGQFHYAIDALGGALLASAVLGFERWRRMPGRHAVSLATPSALH